MALLLRRADEERIGAAARARNGRREARVLQGLVSHDYGAVAAAAMALILGRGRRRDRFGQCLVAFDDLSPASAETIVGAVAAGLRREVAGSPGESAADHDLALASEVVLDGRDEERSIEALTAALVHFLDEAGGLTEELVLAAAGEGEVGFLGEFLARRIGISTASATEELLSGEPASLMLLFRCAGLSRDVVARILADMGDLLGIGDAGAAIAAFDGLGSEQVEAGRAWLTTSASYRAALGRLEQGRG
jgi:hypothetical protein